jgi:hypothetical protein
VCVCFDRATIIKNKGQWFMDDDDLTKQLCPETEVGEDENEESEPCCACDEAKYEVRGIIVKVKLHLLINWELHGV